MRKLDSKSKDFFYLLYRWMSPLIDPQKTIKIFPGYAGYFRDLIRYRSLKGAEPLKIINTYPCIYDKTETTAFDKHYFYQDVWAFKKIYSSGAKKHTDIGSNAAFAGMLTAVTKVTFVDIRPLPAKLENFESKKGSILSIPFDDDSLSSLSSLHVAEHIGLGRYGDPLEPLGTQKACKELSRVLCPGGNLYFSLPVGKPRLCFNAHRIHSPKQILNYFSGLTLVDLSGINDKGDFVENMNIDILENSDYACGLFRFTKK